MLEILKCGFKTKSVLVLLVENMKLFLHTCKVIGLYVQIYPPPLFSTGLGEKKTYLF